MDRIRMFGRLEVEEAMVAASSDRYGIDKSGFETSSKFRGVEIACQFGKVLARVEVEPYLACSHGSYFSLNTTIQ